VKHQQEPYDLVVLDEHMPGMNGRELMAAIRELDGRRDGPGAFIVYSTAEREVRGEGADLILPKPIAIEVLRRRVAGEDASR
jgi:CheY-like chemotaxis protein